MKKWYRVQVKAEARGHYYVYAERSSEAKHIAHDEYVEGRAYWSGLEPDGNSRIVGRAEAVDEIPEAVREELDSPPDGIVARKNDFSPVD